MRSLSQLRGQPMQFPCLLLRSQPASLWSIGSSLQAQHRPCEDEEQVEWRAEPRSQGGQEVRMLNPVLALSIVTGHGPGCQGGRSYCCSSDYPPAAGRILGESQMMTQSWRREGLADKKENDRGHWCAGNSSHGQTCISAVLCLVFEGRNHQWWVLKSLDTLGI